MDDNNINSEINREIEELIKGEKNMKQIPSSKTPRKDDGHKKAKAAFIGLRINAELKNIIAEKAREDRQTISKEVVILVCHALGIDDREYL